MRSPSTSKKEDLSSALFLAGLLGTHPDHTGLVGGLRMSLVYAHEPVLLDEVVDLFGPVPPGTVIDATAGGGGHSAAVLRAHPELSVLALDRDADAVVAATARLSEFAARASVRHVRFGDLEHVVAEAGGAGVSGVLFDLGVSSPQLDRAERGFSYRVDGLLDMRMDQSGGRSAHDLVNEAPVDELTALFSANGEGRLARRIARAIEAARPLSTTAELAGVVADAVPAPARRRGHPARRVFQALRIAVNEELDELARALPAALAALSVGGRCVAIAYHSGEDRMVKQSFASATTGGCTCPPGLPCVCGAEIEYQLVFRGARKASAEEIARNHRAESARLRAIERIAREIR